MVSPGLDVAWVRGETAIDFSKPNVIYSLGTRGSGKSTFLELCASKYLDNGGKVFDLFSSRDGESLAWLRSPYARDRRIVLVRGDLVEVKSNHESIPARKFKISDLDRGDIFISTSPLYSDMNDEFDGVNHIIDVLWKRHHWTQPIFLVMREAANLIYSRLKVRQNQSIAKAEITYMMRESRHCGLALGLDSIKHTSIDVDVRVLTDYLVIKNVGMQGLPEDLFWVYKVFDPHALRRLRPEEFIILDRYGHVGVGTFDMVPWHKHEAENIVREVGLELSYLQPGREGDELREMISEAMRSLPSRPTVEQVARWLRENRRVDVDPISVGIQLRNLGYHTQRVFEGGRYIRIVKKLP